MKTNNWPHAGTIQFQNFSQFVGKDSFHCLRPIIIKLTSFPGSHAPSHIKVVGFSNWNSLYSVCKPIYWLALFGRKDKATWAASCGRGGLERVGKLLLGVGWPLILPCTAVAAAPSGLCGSRRTCTVSYPGIWTTRHFPFFSDTVNAASAMVK